MGERKAKLNRLDIATMLETLPPDVPWLASPLLVRGHLTMIAGREGLGKSLVSLAVAVAVATGDEVAGIEATAGKVVIVDAENGPGEIHRRVRALGLPTSAAANLAVFASDGLDLMQPSDVDELEQVIVQERPALTILDSFRSLYSGPENDSEVVGPVIDRIRNLGRRMDTAILLLHHSGKVGGEYRGSTAIGAGCELVFALGHDPGDSDLQRRHLTCMKSRPAPEPPKRWLHLSTELGMVFVEQCDGPEGPDVQPVGRPATARQELAPRVADIIRDGGGLSQSDVARQCGRKPSDGTVRRVLERLVADGAIERRNGAFHALPNCQIPSVSGNLASSSGDLDRWAQ